MIQPEYHQKAILLRSDVQLEPCPFCGGVARLVQTKDLSGYFYVECATPPCYARILAWPTAQDAADKWNRRIK